MMARFGALPSFASCTTKVAPVIFSNVSASSRTALDSTSVAPGCCTMTHLAFPPLAMLKSARAYGHRHRSRTEGKTIQFARAILRFPQDSISCRTESHSVSDPQSKTLRSPSRYVPLSPAGQNSPPPSSPTLTAYYWRPPGVYTSYPPHISPYSPRLSDGLDKPGDCFQDPNFPDGPKETVRRVEQGGLTTAEFLS